MRTTSLTSIWASFRVYFGENYADMIRIMANENLSDWEATPAVINETVFAAKKFLDGELGKYDSWDEFEKSQLNYFSVGSRKEDFSRLKSNGVGRETIMKFLGDNWSTHMVQEAMAVYRSVQQDEEREARREEGEIN